MDLTNFAPTKYSEDEHVDKRKLEDGTYAKTNQVKFEGGKYNKLFLLHCSNQYKVFIYVLYSCLKGRMT